MKRTKEELIELRKHCLDPEEADRAQEELKAILKKEYKPKHKPSEYYKLITDWNIDAVKEQHSQNTNHPDTIYECFSVVSQHVYGVTKEHCYDQIWDAVEDRKNRIAHYKTLPTLEELVNSNIDIDPEKTYQWKDRGDKYEDSCNGYSGDIILEMRRIGINEYRKIMWEKEADVLGLNDPRTQEWLKKIFEQRFSKYLQA